MHAEPIPLYIYVMNCLPSLVSSASPCSPSSRSAFARDTPVRLADPAHRATAIGGGIRCITPTSMRRSCSKIYTERCRASGEAASQLGNALRLPPSGLSIVIVGYTRYLRVTRTATIAVDRRGRPVRFPPPVTRHVFFFCVLRTVSLLRSGRKKERERVQESLTWQNQTKKCCRAFGSAETHP